MGQKAAVSYSRSFLFLVVLFVTCLLVSNVIAGKLISLLGTILPSAVILFPLTYILGDTLTEVYGFQKARLVIWLGFAANGLMSLVFLAAVALPFPDFFQDQGAYATVLGFAPRVVAASLLAYLAGEFCNSITLSLLKKATHGRWLWTRTVGSTVVGQLVDTALFIAIAFAGLLPLEVLLGMMVAQYFVKVAYEVILTPVTYFIVAKLKKHEGIDTFDEGVSYNPFGTGVR